MVCNAGAATSINSLKAGSTSRVNVDQAEKLWSPRTLGRCDFCPSSAIIPTMDSSGRSLGGNSRRLTSITDPACACIAYPLTQKLRHENAERFMLKCSKDYVGV